MFDPGLRIRQRLRPGSDWNEDDTTNPLHTPSTIGKRCGTYPTIPAPDFDAGGQSLIDELEQ